MWETRTSALRAFWLSAPWISPSKDFQRPLGSAFRPASPLIPCSSAPNFYQPSAFEFSARGNSSSLSVTVSHAVAYPGYPVIQRLATFNLEPLSSWPSIGQPKADTLALEAPDAQLESQQAPEAPTGWQGDAVPNTMPAPSV